MKRPENSSVASARVILLARHGAIDNRYRGHCYGKLDVALSDLGHEQSRQAADDIAAHAPTVLYTSTRRRAQILATMVAGLSGLKPIVDARLDERDYGQWEGLRWDDIYARSGAAMDGIINDPAGFAPPGGETTFAMRDRVLSWYLALPPRGTIVMVGHGGPIAALLGTLAGAQPRDWFAHQPVHGAWLIMDEGTGAKKTAQTQV